MAETEKERRRERWIALAGIDAVVYQLKAVGDCLVAADYSEEPITKGTMAGMGHVIQDLAVKLQAIAGLDGPQ